MERVIHDDALVGQAPGSLCKHTDEITSYVLLVHREKLDVTFHFEKAPTIIGEILLGILGSVLLVKQSFRCATKSLDNVRGGKTVENYIATCCLD
jgi:hypothetical protein